MVGLVLLQTKRYRRKGTTDEKEQQTKRNEKEQQLLQTKRYRRKGTTDEKEQQRKRNKTRKRRKEQRTQRTRGLGGVGGARTADEERDAWEKIWNRTNTRGGWGGGGADWGRRRRAAQENRNEYGKEREQSEWKRTKPRVHKPNAQKQNGKQTKTDEKEQDAQDAKRNNTGEGTQNTTKTRKHTTREKTLGCRLVKNGAGREKNMEPNEHEGWVGWGGADNGNEQSRGSVGVPGV